MWRETGVRPLLFCPALPSTRVPQALPQLLSKDSSQTGTKKHSLTRFGCASGVEWLGSCLGAYHPGIWSRGRCMLRAISSRLVRVGVGEIDHSRNSGKGRGREGTARPPTRPSFRSSGQPQRRLQGSPLPSASPPMLRVLSSLRVSNKSHLPQEQRGSCSFHSVYN